MQQPLITPPNNPQKWVVINYWLYILSILFQILTIVGVVIAYVFRGDANGTYLESHFTYQIRTFWIGLLYSFIAAVLSVIFIGYLLLIGVFIWWLVRAIKGLRAVSNQQPIINEKTWLF